MEPSKDIPKEVSVNDHERAGHEIIYIKNKASFDFYTYNVRLHFCNWIRTLQYCSLLPTFIYRVIMTSNFDFFSYKVFNIEAFAAILLFFETNRAPIEIRRMFWEWILHRPIFSNGYTGHVRSTHDYAKMFKCICALNMDKLGKLGAFTNLRSQAYVGYSGNTWNAFNVWGCEGINIKKGESVDWWSGTLNVKNNQPKYRGIVTKETFEIFPC